MTRPDKIQLKAQWKSDVDSVDRFCDAYKLWLSALGALLVLSITGILTYHSLLASEPFELRLLVGFFLITLSVALVSVSVSWGMEILNSAYSIEFSNLADSVSDDDSFLDIYLKKKAAIEWEAIAYKYAFPWAVGCSVASLLALVSLAVFLVL